MKDLFRQLVALLLPLVALTLQWIFWPAIQPFVWFLFYPAVFFSSWIGGLHGGLAATAISTTIVWWLFIPLVHSQAAIDPKTLVSVAVFMGMGVLFSLLQGRLRKANRQATEALDVARRANDELQGANEKITKLYEKTRELDDLKTQFFANVSHELRTPLTLILGPVGKRLRDTDLTEEARQDLEVVDRNARLLYRHVSDLLDVAKIEAGRMAMRYARIDLARLVRLAASHFEVAASEKQVRFTLDVPEELPAQLDSEKCGRVLLNLLSNAFKFTPEGGAISLSLRVEGERAVMEVRDNGPGVPADMHDAVFERFRQVEGGTERRYGGTGLGLAIVKEFAELHGGSVGIGDAPGGGAIFSVSLPLAAPEDMEVRFAPDLPPAEEIDRELPDEFRTRHAPAPASRGVPGDEPLILVVEDNPDMNAFVVDALSPQYLVETAFDGEEGLAKALSIHPDLIVCDVMMPRMGGDKMVEALRRHPEMIDVPIILLTAKADDALRVEMLDAGAQDYLSKPFLVEELLARVGGLVSRGKRSRDLGARLAAIVESSDDGIIGKTLEGVIASWNCGAERLFGYSEREAVGKPMVMLFPPDRTGEEREILSRIKRGERVQHFDTVRIGKDGKPVEVSVAISPIKDAHGRIIGASTIARDITERKRAERELQESERLLRTLSDQIPGGALYQHVQRPDGEMHYAYMSAGIEKLFGLPVKDILADPDVFSRLIVEEDRPRIASATEKSARELTPFDCELRQRTVTGETKWVQCRSMPHLLEDGSILWDGVVVDITERKQAEDALLASLREKEVLLNEIHHRVKNNMQVISSLVSLQADELEDGSMRSILKDVDHRVRSMALVHEKLYQSADLARVELAEYTESLLNYLWSAHGSAASGIRLALDLEPVSLPVDTAVPCGLILNELLINALKHAFHGRDGGEVSVVLRADSDGKVRLCVRDDGVGLPEGFDWKQARSLGLHLVRMLSRQLRATVEVKSIGGTEFEIVFKGSKT